MFLNLDYLKRYEEIDILIRVSKKELSTLLEKELQGIDLIYHSKNHMLIDIHYSIKPQIFKVKYEPLSNGYLSKKTLVRETIILYETKVDSEIREFLNKLNTIYYTIEDEDY